LQLGRIVAGSHYHWLKTAVTADSGAAQSFDEAARLNESNQILHAPLPHLLVESAHRMFLKVV